MFCRTFWQALPLSSCLAGRHASEADGCCRLRTRALRCPWNLRRVVVVVKGVEDLSFPSSLLPDCLLDRSLFLHHLFFFFLILPLNKTGANAGCSTFTTLKGFNLQKFQPLLSAGIFFLPSFFCLVQPCLFPLGPSCLSLELGFCCSWVSLTSDRTPLGEAVSVA